MGRAIIMCGSGSDGADLDVITAEEPDVLAGKVIVDKDGEPLAGTMPDRGAVSPNLNAGESYTILEGYHNGSGRVTANSLASQTSGNASAGHILSGKTAWVNGQKIPGNIASMGGQTITPNAYSHTLSCSGKYMTGNVYVPAVSNLSAGNIKKGVTVGGVTGTHSGYVPTSTDLYLRGNNVMNWRSTLGSVRFDSGQITVLDNNIISLYSGIEINLSGYSQIHAETYITHANEYRKFMWVGYYNNQDKRTDYVRISTSEHYTGQGARTFTCDISVVNITKKISLDFQELGGGRDDPGAIYRIWMT